MNVNTIVEKNVRGWNEAIQDAERQLAEAEGRSQRLKDVIEVFKTKRDSGETWPSEAVTPLHASTQN